MIMVGDVIVHSDLLTEYFCCDIGMTGEELDQNLGVIAEMEAQSGEKIDQAKWNPNGGAISIGHPNGASGARIAMFAMKQLEMTGGKYGLFSSCCGGGHGTTTIIENLRR